MSGNLGTGTRRAGADIVLDESLDVGSGVFTTNEFKSMVLSELTSCRVIVKHLENTEMEIISFGVIDMIVP